MFVEENNKLRMVEAAGVEPASESVTGQETTCVVSSCPRHYPGTFATLAQNGQETVAASLRSLPLSPDVEEKSSPLCDVLRRPTGEASSNGCLN